MTKRLPPLSFIAKHYAVLFSVFVLLAVSPLVMFLILQKINKPIPQLANFQNQPQCYYKKLQCKDGFCDSAILTCPSAALIANTDENSGNFSPTGLFENADCQKATGWAYNAQFPDRIMTISLYADAEAPNGKLLATFPANLKIDDNDVVNIFGSHEFYYPTPLQLKDGAIHELYAYGSDASGSANLTLLLGSPKEIACSPTKIIKF